MGSVFNAAPRPLYRRDGDPIPIVLETGCESKSCLGGYKNISPLPEFDPRIVQPVASRYFDCSVVTVLLLITSYSLFNDHYRLAVQAFVRSASEEQGSIQTPNHFNW